MSDDIRDELIGLLAEQHCSPRRMADAILERFLVVPRDLIATGYVLSAKGTVIGTFPDADSARNFSRQFSDVELWRKDTHTNWTAVPLTEEPDNE